MGSNMPVQDVTVISANGEFPVQIEPSSTVAQLKNLIWEENGVRIERQKLSFLGWPLDDDQVKLDEFLELGNIFNLTVLDPAGNKGAGKGNSCVVWRRL